MSLRFVVIVPGEPEPIAVFAVRHDALKWATGRFDGVFRIEEMVVQTVPAAVVGASVVSA
jgi:hypothetical protein